MKRLRQQVLVAIVLAVCAAFGLAPARAQQPIPTLQELRLAKFVDTASARAYDYFSFFRDLTAEETKLVEQFRENGEVSKRRSIVSDLIVYKSLLDNGSISEYRDVKTVDGEPVSGRQERVQALFAKQARSKSVRDELKRVNAEGSRYDLDYTVSGLTMSQGLPLQPWARALFTFEEAGTEAVDGREAVVLTYRQVAPNSRFGFNLSLPADLRAAEPLFRGRLWLEPGTSRLVREIREVTVLPGGTSRPVVVQRLEFRYATSRFDVLLPTRIVFSSLGHFSRTDAGFSSTLKYRLTFAYGEFRRFTASSDDNELADAAAGDERTPVTSPEPEPSVPDVSGRNDDPTSDSDLGPEFGPDAPLGPPATAAVAQPPGRSELVAVNRSPERSSRVSVPNTNSTRLTVAVGLPASAAFAIPGSPLLSYVPIAAGLPQVPIPPPPLAPGEKPKFRPPPS